MRNDLAPGGRNCPLLGEGPKSISSGAQYVTLAKIFFISHPSLVMYSFATPRIKLKLGQQIGGGLLIANHTDESLWWANQKHWAAVRSYLLHSFLQVHSAASESSPAMATCAIMLSENQFPESNRHMLDFLHQVLLCTGSHTEHRWRCSKFYLMSRSEDFSSWRGRIFLLSQTSTIYIPW
jgi:hypothetical protein